jgi:hypothetical protein
MKQLMKTLLAATLVFPASVFAESDRVESVKQATQEERTETVQSLDAELTEADSRLNQLNQDLEKIKANREDQKMVALYAAAITTVSGVTGLLLTSKNIKSNPIEVRASVGTLFTILTALTAVTSADNVYQAMLSEDKITDLQTEIFGVKRKIQLIKEQISNNKGQDL